MAHMIVNDMQRQFAGKPGIFESQIAFASNRSGFWEIWLMDWDGANQRQITRHNALSILPSWSADNERLVYTSFARGTSDMYIIHRRGGARIHVASMNRSPSTHRDRGSRERPQRRARSAS